MGGSARIEILSSADFIRPWQMTQRPFEHDRSLLRRERLAPLEAKLGPWEKIKYQLGFQEAEVADWVNSGYPILEVGPGRGISSKQLRDRGVNLFVIEPTLRANETIRGTDSYLVDQARDLFISDQFQGRVSAVNAVDAHLAFPEEKFRVAFAIGNNFQTFARSEAELINGIRGLLFSLEENQESFLTFALKDDGKLALEGSLGKQVNLLQFLDDNNIRYTYPIPSIVEGATPAEAYEVSAIRIYRQSQIGEDAAHKFDVAVNADLSAYLSES